MSKRKVPPPTDEFHQMAPWRQSMHEVIFEADTFWGKTFDVALLFAILVSVIAVMLDSVDSLHASYGRIFYTLEIVLTIFFSIEYVARILSIPHPRHYIFSFYGIVDLLACLPFYIGLFLTGPEYLIVIRALRLVRVFRILKLARFIKEAQLLGAALRASRAKITVFLIAVAALTIILGTVMYIVEGGQPDTGFTSIPRSVYWTIVTLTTVGYGDIAPQTVLGQTIASIVMILGYAVIAVPTGIVSAEVVRDKDLKQVTTQSCPNCTREGHDADAEHCKFCGYKL